MQHKASKLKQYQITS